MGAYLRKMFRINDSLIFVLQFDIVKAENTRINYIQSNRLTYFKINYIIWHLLVIASV